MRANRLAPMERMGEAIGGQVRKYVDAQTRPLLERIEALSKRLATIEEKGIQYRGQFNASDDYTRGDLVTFKGSIFHCVRDCSGEPPHTTDPNGQSRPSGHWQLAVKKGRDAREAR